jgi:hypothetical protein
VVWQGHLCVKDRRRFGEIVGALPSSSSRSSTLSGNGRIGLDAFVSSWGRTRSDDGILVGWALVGAPWSLDVVRKYRGSEWRGVQVSSIIDDI